MIKGDKIAGILFILFLGYLLGYAHHMASTSYNAGIEAMAQKPTPAIINGARDARRDMEKYVQQRMEFAVKNAVPYQYDHKHEKMMATNTMVIDETDFYKKVTVK